MRNTNSPYRSGKPNTPNHNNRDKEQFGHVLCDRGDSPCHYHRVCWIPFLSLRKGQKARGRAASRLKHYPVDLYCAVGAVPYHVTAWNPACIAHVLSATVAVKNWAGKRRLA